MASLLGVTVGVAVSASASSLELDTGDVGSGAATVMPCRSAALAVACTVSYHPALPGYEVTVRGLEAGSGGGCACKAFPITLTGDRGASLAEIGGTTPESTSFVADFSPHHVNAEDVTAVHVSIAG